MSFQVSPESSKSSPPSMPSFSPEKQDDNVSITFQYIIIVVAAAVVALVVIVVVLLLLRKRRTSQLRHHLVPLYNFDTSDDCQEWEAELLDDECESYSFKKGYKSMAFHSEH